MASETANLSPTRSRLSLLLWCLIVLGVTFRFYNLDKKLFWHDETITMYHVSGYTMPELYDQLAIGHPLQFKECATFQRVNPERGPSFVLHSLSSNQSGHAPLFYLAAYFWAKTFGCAVGTMRYLPSLLSIFQLPCLYWLAMELFAEPLAAELAVAFMALSPLQLLYAQQLREYSLFTTVIILASAALLRAIRSPVLANWILYLFSLVISLYTSVLSALVIIAHCAYLVVRFEIRWNRIMACFLGSVLLSAVMFTPWLLEMIHNAQSAYLSVVWLTESVPTPVLVNTWFDNIARIFVDLGDNHLQLSNCLSAFVLLIVGYAAYEILHRGKEQSSLFVIALFLIPAIAFPLLDIFSGGQRSLYIKYMMPIPIAILLSVSYALYLRQNTTTESVRTFWRGVAGYLLCCEIASCAVISQATIWTNKVVRHQDVVQVAAIINKDPHAMLISEFGKPLVRQTNLVQMLVLSRLTRPETYFELSGVPKLPTSLPGIDHYYLFNPSPESLDLLKAHGYTVAPVEKLDYFYLATLRTENNHQ